MNVGDWVYSYSKGIWQITRIDEIENGMQPSTIQIVVHCKRFLNTSYKKSFQAECCSPLFIHPLPYAEMEKLNSIISTNPKWLVEFNVYDKFVDSIFNLSFYAKDENAKEYLRNIILERCSDLEIGFTRRNVEQLLAKELENNKLSTIRNFTAQFISEKSEVQDKKLVYRKLKFLNF